MDTFLALLAGNTLTRLVFFPTLAALPLLFFPKGAAKPAKVYLLAVSLIEVLFGLQFLVTHMGPGGTFPMVRDGSPLAWIPGYGIRYDVAMDGISMPLVMQIGRAHV
jgi:NADH:ubiquinone oxidoreductase subunit 4 (subunit M)